MKAIVVRSRQGGVDLSWEDAPDPQPGPDEVLLDVHATAVNRADLLQARGLYPPPPEDSPILGLEVAGQIRSVGRKVEAWKPGDRVCSLALGGGYAEQTVLPQGLLIPLPKGWSYVTGAAVSEVWLTAYSNLCREGAMQSGETVLIHAGASGVGTAAIQLAGEWDAQVIVTAGSAQKLARCRELGAYAAINYHEENFAEAVMSLTDHRGVDLILDCIGGSYLEKNVSLLRPYGRLITIGLLGGTRGTLDLAAVLMKSLTLKGTRLRARSREEKAEITHQFRDQVWPLMVAGKITPIVDRVFPITAASQAHEYVKKNQNIGKVVLEVRANEA
jgi:putative PIG3 family NAD(P)H quinone oxidoreductase